MTRLFASTRLFTITILFLSACSAKEVLPPAPVGPLPSKAQLAWHAMEMNAFIHFSINTFTDKEWGFGDESPKLFNPSQLDATQWVSVLKAAGFRGIILTCKHHDGFCLWPSKYTSHSVKSSPYKNGNGDVVRELSEACKQAGLKFGIYLSPWDRNHAAYGSTPYIDYYRNQLRELFSQYGPAFEMWFDGANGGSGFYGGVHEKRTINGAIYYDWPSTLDLVRKMEPEIIFFSDAGPGVRWCGNERGVGGETNWNTITPDTLFAGKAGIEQLLNKGSENGTHWIPAEVNTSIRPGWFYHAQEDSLVKSPEQLFEIYLTSVGRGSTFLLNVPPDRRGLIHENDIRSLKGWRTLLDSVFKDNLAHGASVSSSSFRGSDAKFSPENTVDDNPESYWATDDGITSGVLEINLEVKKIIHFLMIQEYIQLGQRVKAFTVEVWMNDQWKTVAHGTTVGYKRILKLDPLQTSRLRISITDSRASPIISHVAVY